MWPQEVIGQTTNATPLTLISIPLLAGQTAILNVIAVARDTSGNVRSSTKKATIKNVSDTLSIVGLVQDIITPVTDVNISSASFTITTSGTNMLLQATGIAATTINWKISYDLIML